MNLRIEIEIAFQETAQELEDMLVAFADILRDSGYGNDQEEAAILKSYIRVKKIDDDEVIVVVIPKKPIGEGEVNELNS